MDETPTSFPDDTSTPPLPRLRAINVEVPEEVYWHIRQCATDSRLSMKDYMAKFCQEAWPYPNDDAASGQQHHADQHLRLQSLIMKG